MDVYTPLAAVAPEYDYDLTGYTPADDQVFTLTVEFKDPSRETLNISLTNGNAASGTLLDADGICSALTDAINEYSEVARVSPPPGAGIQNYRIYATFTPGSLITIGIVKFWDPEQQKVGGPNPLADNASDYYGFKHSNIEVYDAHTILSDTQVVPPADPIFPIIPNAALVDPMGTGPIMTYYCNLHSVTPGALPGLTPYDTIDITWKEWIPGANGHRAYKEMRYLGFADAAGNLRTTVSNIRTATGYTFEDYVLKV